MLKLNKLFKFHLINCTIYKRHEKEVKLCM